MTIKLVHSDQEADYIRYARTETLKSIGEKPSPAQIEPSWFGMYFMAYDEQKGERPVAMAEVAFLDQVYRNFEDSVYPASLGLERVFSLDEACGIRTIYVDPGYRHKASSLYLQLIWAGAWTVDQLGCQFATATTTTVNHGLRQLYLKTGGREMGVFPIKGVAECDTVLYLFGVRELLAHRLIARVGRQSDHEIDLELVSVLRARRLWDEDS